MRDYIANVPGFLMSFRKMASVQWEEARTCQQYEGAVTQDDRQRVVATMYYTLIIETNPRSLSTIALQLSSCLVRLSSPKVDGTA